MSPAGLKLSSGNDGRQRAFLGDRIGSKGWIRPVGIACDGVRGSGFMTSGTPFESAPLRITLDVLSLREATTVARAEINAMRGNSRPFRMGTVTYLDTLGNQGCPR